MINSNVLTNNQRIVKNTIFLYIRMIFVLFANLYISRVVLKSLGVVDYGVYNVVGSIVFLFSYVNSALSVATTRFFSYEMSSGDEQLNLVFNTSIMVQFVLAFAFVLLSETVGLWIINEKLVLPPERLCAANWVFQFSIIATIISIIRVSYESVITSYEHMHIYAFFSIIEVLVKLCLVLLIPHVMYDRLICYSILMLIVSIVGFLLRYVYCNRNYHMVRVKRVANKPLFRKIMAFVGWNFFGATAGMSVSQGLSFVLNLFFGPIVNAAQGVAIQVETAIAQLATGINTAINPQIVKRYSIGDKKGVFDLSFFASKIVFILLLIVSTPIIFNIDYVLKIWLECPPNYAGVFTQLELIYMLTLSLTYSVNMCAQASGNIKKFQMVEGCLLILNIPVAILLYKFSLPPYSALISLIVISLITLFAKLFVVKQQISFPMEAYVKNVISPVLSITIFLGLLYYFYTSCISLPSSFGLFVLYTIAIWFVLIPLIWIIVLNMTERKMLIGYIHKYFAKFTK